MTLKGLTFLVCRLAAARILCIALGSIVSLVQMLGSMGTSFDETGHSVELAIIIPLCFYVGAAAFLWFRAEYLSAKILGPYAER